MLKRLIAIVVLCLLVGAWSMKGDSTSNGWRTLTIGPGGFITGISIANDNTKVVRTDVFGGYIFDIELNRWRQLVTVNTIPPAVVVEVSGRGGAGVWEIAVAPNNPKRIYMMYVGALLRSDDGGRTFIRTGLPLLDNAESNNGAGRLNGRKMAVDPSNADILYVGTPQIGVRKSTDAGGTFSLISAIPPSFPNYTGAYFSGTTAFSQATSSGTSAASAVLNFADTTNVTVGWYVVDLTTPLAIPQGAKVQSKTSTTVTLDQAVVSPGVGSADSISFAQAGATGVVYPGYSLVYDASSTVTSNVTQIMYICTWGTGVWRTANGGSSWTQLSSGGPTTCKNSSVAASGTLWVPSQDSDYTGANTNVWKYASGSWTRVTHAAYNAQAAQAVNANPTDSTKVVALDAGGIMNISNDTGGTWTGPLYGPSNFPAGAGTRVTGTGEAGWLAWTQESSMTTSNALFDSAGKLWLAQGIGVWWATVPASWQAFNWNSFSRGIEELVANDIIAPLGVFTPQMVSWDRPYFKSFGLNNAPAIGGMTNIPSIMMGWTLDWASSTPATICAYTNYYGYQDYSGCSQNGGSTWTRFTQTPTVPEATVTSTAAAGSSVLTFSGGVPGNIVAGHSGTVRGFPITATAAVASGQTVLTFASVPSGITAGMFLTPVYPTAVETGTGKAPYGTVLSTTSTTITLTSALLTGVSIGDVFTVKDPAFDALSSAGTVLSKTATTVTMTGTTSGNSILSGQTVAFTGANVGGHISVSTPNNMIVLPNIDSAWVFYTKDGGATWNPIILVGSGFNADGSSIYASGYGWGFSNFAAVHNSAADRVTPNKFYIFNCKSSANGGGIWVTTDGGDTWGTRIFAGPPTGTSANCQYGNNLVSVPDNANHLMFVCGVFCPSPLKRSTDGGVTWSDFGGVTDVQLVGFGKAKPSVGTYPSIYVYGVVAAIAPGVTAIYRSDDAGSTWTALTTPPNASLDFPNRLTGDMNIWGRVYVSFGGSGWAWGQFN